MALEMPERVAGLTGELLDALIGHYRKPDVTGGDGEVLLPEVQAPRSGRRCDLLRIGLWPSRGYGIDVHELKVSRSDWQRELADPGKADAWWPYCSRFWIVAPKGMIRPEEMPLGWGLMEPPSHPRHRRFRVVVQPEQREPKLTVQLVAALVSRTENLRADYIRRLKVDHRNEIDRTIRAERQRAGMATLDSRTRERLALLGELEGWLGMELHDFPWRDENRAKPMELGFAMKDYVRDHVALQRRSDEINDRMMRLRRAAEQVLNEMRRDGA